jgi:hypothetical protein
MALRLGWGEKPAFLMSVGGFHPQFEAPERFPTLRRVTLALGTGANPRFTLQSYTALTSNTLQLGAKAELFAEALGFKLQGLIGFDALVTFVPFSFRVDFTAGLKLSRGSMVLASIAVDGLIEGPKPWHVHGKAKVSVLFLEKEVEVDVRFGAPEAPAPLPAPRPRDALLAALADKGNWSTVLPSATARTVALAAREGEGLLDPAGAPAVRQQVVPLGLEIARFQHVPLASPERFAISGAKFDAAPGATSLATTATRERFAVAQFTNLSDAEKLSRPSFEPLEAGVVIDGDALTAGAGLPDTLAYETIVVDDTVATIAPYTPTLGRTLAATRCAAGALGRQRSGGMARFAPEAMIAPLVQLEDEDFCLGATNDLRLGAALMSTGLTRTEAEQALRAHEKSVPADRGRYQVIPSYELQESA